MYKPRENCWQRGYFRPRLERKSMVQNVMNDKQIACRIGNLLHRTLELKIGTGHDLLFLLHGSVLTTHLLGTHISTHNDTVEELRLMKEPLTNCT